MFRWRSAILLVTVLLVNKDMGRSIGFGHYGPSKPMRKMRVDVL